MRKTKIVATLGPATRDPEIIKKMINAGMNAARINFSHGTYETHSDTVTKLKTVREELNAPVPLILDTKGPEIRIGKLESDNIYLKQGETFTLTTDDIIGDETKVSVSYKNLPKDLKVGSRILIDDGLIELKAVKLTKNEIVTEIVNSGFLSSSKGVNVPDVYVNLPSLTQKDIEDIKFGISMGFDFIAASFIRSANDILKIRDVLEKNNGGEIMIIAKIESRDGVDNIDSILEVADGIMVARGDLGVEILPEEVPLVQKMLIRKSNMKGKPVITATQMLESMVNNPRPTRAEANDVANAIFDGSDAIMLSGETAKGAYPVESIQIMSRIAEATEGSIDYSSEMLTHHASLKTNITNAVSFGAASMADDLNAACICAVTDSGFTARMMSKYKLNCPILAVTASEVVWRQLNLSWGCYPTVSKQIRGNEEVFEIAVAKSLETGLAKDGDSIVIAAGVPVGIAGTTNTLKVQVVGDVLARGKGIGERTVIGNANVIKIAEDVEKYFRAGDILVTTNTTNEMIPLIKKASAIVVGSWELLDYSHAETVAAALDKPLVICGQKVIDLIRDGLMISVDTKKGFVYNGVRENDCENG